MVRTLIVALMALVLAPLITCTGATLPDPILIGHRGLLEQAPENTLRAFIPAVQLGHGIELDVRTSLDGELVVLHDSTLNRTTNVEEVFPGRPSWGVSKFTLAELRQLDAGSWFHPRFAGTKIPTLDEALAAVASNKTGRTIVALNVKSLTPAGEVDLVATVGNRGLLGESFAFDQSDAASGRLKALGLRIGGTARNPDALAAALADPMLDVVMTADFGPTANDVQALVAAGKQPLFNNAGQPGDRTRLSEASFLWARNVGMDGYLTNFPTEGSQFYGQVGGVVNLFLNVDKEAKTWQVAGGILGAGISGLDGITFDVVGENGITVPDGTARSPATITPNVQYPLFTVSGSYTGDAGNLNVVGSVARTTLLPLDSQDEPFAPRNVNGMSVAVVPSPEVPPGAVPTSIPGLELWLDGDDASTFTLAGNEVDLWQDKSGLNNDALPGAVKPTRVTGAINGRDAVDFAGGADSVKSNVTGTPGSGTPVHLLGMALSLPEAISAASPGEQLLGLRGDGTSSSPGADPFVGLGLGSITSGLSNEIIHLSEAAGRRGWTDPAASMPAGTNILLIYHEAGVGYQINLNGTPLPMTNGTDPTFINDVVSITLGKRDGDNNVPYNGLIGELVVYNTPVGAADRETLRQYLTDKWVVPDPAAVVGRHVFYNNSAFGDAIAIDKRALLPGETASFENYTTFDRGINGIVIDLANAPNASAITLDDFEFSLGLNNDPNSWAPLPDDVLLGGSLDVQLESGVDQSDRIVLTLPDGLANAWLKVTVKATDNTGLDEDDVFYFGNVVGETGNDDSNMLANAADLIGVRDNARGEWSPAGIDSRFDFNRDGAVDALDLAITRNNATSPLSALQLLDPSALGAPMAAPVPEPASAVLLGMGTAGMLLCQLRRRRRRRT